MNELILVKQIPIIEEQLKTISDEIIEKVETALAMVCTEETVKEVKAIRADLKKDFTELENKRKEVKSAIMAPYEQFETIYKNYVTNVFNPADAQLKEKIDDVENGLKEQKQIEILKYFNEYIDEKKIDFVTFLDAGITVLLSSSIKSLKEQVKSFVDKIVDDLALIETQENKPEILVEYKRSLNVSQAITTISARQKAIAEENARAEAERLEKIKNEELKTMEKAETFDDVAVKPADETPAVEVKKPEEAPAERVYIVKMSIKGTVEQLKSLKDYLLNNSIEYESGKMELTF